MAAELNDLRERLILVYGDSLSLPRVIDKVAVRDTYPELLAESQSSLSMKAYVANRGEGGKTINDHWKHYINDLNFFEFLGNDILIIHAGMVDCAPRPLPQKWRRRLERQPKFIREPIISFIKNNRPLMLKKGFVFYKVEPALFKQRIEEWLEHAAQRFRHVAVIPMPPIGQAAEDLSPGWRGNIVLYNKILADAVARHEKGVYFVPLYDWLSQSEELFEKCISPLDGYHLLRDGHRLIFEFIRDCIKGD
jgi:lysophospholipase L1-like esterase